MFFKFFKLYMSCIIFFISTDIAFCSESGFFSFLKRFKVNKICPIMISSNQEEKQEDKEKICSICLESIDKNMNTLMCNHFFHSECLEKYINFSVHENKKSTCPMCRANITGRIEWVMKQKEHCLKALLCCKRNRVNFSRYMLMFLKTREGEKKIYINEETIFRILSR